MKVLKKVIRKTKHTYNPLKIFFKQFDKQKKQPRPKVR